jgi:exodeoxyribonuclease VII small subunit
LRFFCYKRVENDLGTKNMTDDVKKLSFEQAVQELETIVKKLESGDIPLEESIHAYERGVALKKHCEKTLQEARMKIEKISLDENGTPVSTQEIPAELAQLD